jgi:hypothetical protein
MQSQPEAKIFLTMNSRVAVSNLAKDNSMNEINVHRCVAFALRARECLEVLCTIRWRPPQQEKSYSPMQHPNEVVPCSVASNV